MNYAASRPLLIPKSLRQSSWIARDYQCKIINETEEWRRLGHHKILVTAPPGSGKTGIMAELARRAYLKGQKTTILVPFNCVVTKSEIDLTQTCGALVSAGLVGAFGVISGAFPNLQNLSAPIQVVTLQSLGPYQQWLSDTSEIIIDEGHSASFFAEAEKAYTNWRWKNITSFTATPFNRSMGRDERHGTLQRHTAIVMGPTYRQLERDGYLASLRYHGIEAIGTGKELELDSDDAIKWMLSNFISTCNRLGIPKTHAVGFVKAKKNGSNQSEKIIRLGKSLGLNFAVVGDGVSPTEYAELMRRFEEGETNLLCCQSLSTGWDSPLCRHTMLFRRIPSRDRYMQCVTRNDRPHPSKPFGEVWDFAGNIQMQCEDWGLHPKVEDLTEMIDATVLETKEKSSGEALIKNCVKCNKSLHAAAMICPHCESVQPVKDKIFALPSGQMVSFVPESVARSGRDGLKSFFHQHRKIAISNNWSPFAAHKVCKDLGFDIPMDDPFFWKGSTGCDQKTYTAYLQQNKRRWNWDDAKCLRELSREYSK